jgi:hypothetical protein
MSPQRSREGAGTSSLSLETELVWLSKLSSQSEEWAEIVSQPEWRSLRAWRPALKASTKLSRHDRYQTGYLSALLSLLLPCVKAQSTLLLL